MIFDTYEFSSRGGRSYNEDSVGSRVEGDHGVFVVADGLGGHSFGELASACVRDTLLNAFPCRDGDPAQWLAVQIADANQRVLALQQEKNAVLKSTVAALYIMGSRAIWAHAGDSRLYYIHEGRLTAYTEDHSVAYKKFKAGKRYPALNFLNQLQLLIMSTGLFFNNFTAGITVATAETAKHSDASITNCRIPKLNTEINNA